MFSLINNTMKKSEVLKLIKTHKIRVYVATSHDDGDWYPCSKQALINVLKTYDKDDFIKAIVHNGKLMIG